MLSFTLLLLKQKGGKKKEPPEWVCVMIKRACSFVAESDRRMYLLHHQQGAAIYDSIHAAGSSRLLVRDAAILQRRWAHSKHSSQPGILLLVTIVATIR